MLKINFLLQATRILNIGNYDEDELKMIYNFIVSVDNVVLNHYNNSKTILPYSTDLELYVDIVNELIKIYEEREEYENCALLIIKKEESINLLNNN